MDEAPKKKRQYNRITPQTVAQFKALEAINGNGSEAVAIQTPSILNKGERAWRIRKKPQDIKTVDYIENTIQQIGIDAINRVGKMVNSVDERVATKNAHFVIEHIRGKAIQKTEGKHLNINIEAVLD